MVVPEAMNGTLAAEIVVESNGGTRRIAVRVGLPDSTPEIPAPVAGMTGMPGSELFRHLGRKIASYPMPTRLLAGVLGALAFRALVLASGWIPIGAGGASLLQPRLPALGRRVRHPRPDRGRAQGQGGRRGPPVRSDRGRCRVGLVRSHGRGGGLRRRAHDRADPRSLGLLTLGGGAALGGHRRGRRGDHRLALPSSRNIPGGLAMRIRTSDRGNPAARRPGAVEHGANPRRHRQRPTAASVAVTGVSEKAFPRITVQFEVKRGDGSYLRDARRDDFRVTEDGREIPVVEFLAPVTSELIPTTLVLVVDRSGSMRNEDRIGGLKRAVAAFLAKLPAGSRVALVSFASEVDRLSEFTTDLAGVREAVDGLEADGSTKFYDAVARSLELLEGESGRRAVLALTDGEDTASEATLDSVIASAKRLGLPVYTLGLGREGEVRSQELRLLADSTRGQYYPARRADQLRAIYEQIAERIGSGYVLTYQTDRSLPDGTLRPIRVSYRGGRSSGEAAVFIPGMVVPAGGWSPLFLGLATLLGALLLLPPYLTRRAVPR